jgi:hypothetical protein
MNKQEAAAFLGFMVGRVGGGYHPDNPVNDYVSMKTGKKVFTPAEIAMYQDLHNEMCMALGNDVYKLGLVIFSKALNL